MSPPILAKYPPRQISRTRLRLDVVQQKHRRARINKPIRNERREAKKPFTLSPPRRKHWNRKRIGLVAKLARFSLSLFFFLCCVVFCFCGYISFTVLCVRINALWFFGFSHRLNKGKDEKGRRACMHFYAGLLALVSTEKEGTMRGNKEDE